MASRDKETGRPELDEAEAREQVLAAGQRLLAREPGLQALVLECTNLPPYAHALREATGLPVHDIVSLLNERMALLRAALQASAPANGLAMNLRSGEARAAPPDNPPAESSLSTHPTHPA